MIIGGLDVGTTGCKIALYDEECNLLNTYYNEYNAIHKNGQHEVDFNDVKNGVMTEWRALEVLLLKFLNA